MCQHAKIINQKRCIAAPSTSSPFPPSLKPTGRHTRVHIHTYAHSHNSQYTKPGLLCAEVLHCNGISNNFQLTEKHRFSSIVGDLSIFQIVKSACARAHAVLSSPIHKLCVTFGISSLCLNRFLCLEYQPNLPFSNQVS